MLIVSSQQCNLLQALAKLVIQRQPVLLTQPNEPAFAFLQELQQLTQFHNPAVSVQRRPY